MESRLHQRDMAPVHNVSFQSKDKFIQRIKELPVSRSTVKERIGLMQMSSNIRNQLTSEIADFSVCLN